MRQIGRSFPIFLVSAVLVLLVAAQEARAQACDAVAPDNCVVETFNSATTGNKGATWTSPNGFVFTVIQGGGTHLLDDFTNLGHGLLLGCDSTLMEIPDKPREYVTLVFKGFTEEPPTTLNLIAVDSNGNIVDATTKNNPDLSEGAEVIHLGTGEAPIAEVYMHQVLASECEENCNESVISEVRACNRQVNN